MILSSAYPDAKSSFIQSNPNNSKRIVAFGDAQTGSFYDYRNALNEMSLENKVIEKQSATEAFSQFYDNLVSKLAQKAQNPGLDKVDTTLLTTKKTFSDNMVDFVKLKGIEDKFAGSKVEEFLTKQKGFKPPSFFDRFKPEFLPFFELKILMEKTYTNFVQKGLIVFKNLV